MGRKHQQKKAHGEHPNAKTNKSAKTIDRKVVVFARKTANDWDEDEQNQDPMMAGSECSHNSDQQGNKKKTKKRTYDPCTSCDQMGHSSSRCLSFCFLCKLEDPQHFAEDCPMRCHCDEDSIWHLSDQCITKCYACWKMGHKSVVCPDLCTDAGCGMSRKLHSVERCEAARQHAAEMRAHEERSKEYDQMNSIMRCAGIEPEFECKHCGSSDHFTYSCRVSVRAIELSQLIPSVCPSSGGKKKKRRNKRKAASHL